MVSNRSPFILMPCCQSIRPSNFPFCAPLAISGDSKSGFSEASASSDVKAALGSFNATYQARNGCTAKDRPMMSESKIFSPVVSVSKTKNPAALSCTISSSSCSRVLTNRYSCSTLSIFFRPPGIPTVNSDRRSISRRNSNSLNRFNNFLASAGSDSISSKLMSRGTLRSIVTSSRER